MPILHRIISYHNMSPNGSTAHDISSYIVDHLNEIGNYSIEELAFKSNASVATVNRQIRAMCGLTFKQFQKEITRNLKYYPNENHCYNFYNHYPRDKDGYLECLTDCVAKLKASCNNSLLEAVCKEIHEHKSIRVHMPFADSSSKCQFQMDLMVSGKKTMFLSHFEEWSHDIANVDEDTLLFATNSAQPDEYSITDYVDLLLKAKERGAFIVAINARGRADIEKYSNLCISFEDTRTAMNALLIDVIFNLLKVIYRKEYMIY